MERPSTVKRRPQAQPFQPPCRWQGPPPPSAFTLVNTALSMVTVALASSCVLLLGVLHVLPPSTSLIQLRPPAWTALLATLPLVLAQPSWLTVLAVLLASMLQLGPAPLALRPHTSLPQLQPPAWTALHVALVRAVVGPLDALAALLASMLQLGPAPPALPPSTSQHQPPPPAWTALLATSPMPLAQPSWLTALGVLLGSILKLGPAPPVFSPHTSLCLPPPPAWTALLASSPLALVSLSALAALLAYSLEQGTYHH